MSTSNQICLLAIPGFPSVAQGDTYFAHRLANSLSGFGVCLIAPKTSFTRLSSDATYQFIDIKNTKLAIEKINEAALVIKCPLLRADVPQPYLPILQKKKEENRFFTIQEYNVDEHYINQAECDKKGLTLKVDLLTGLGPRRLGILISKQDGRNEFKDLGSKLQTLIAGYSEKSLLGFGYGHTKSLALFPWLVYCSREGLTHYDRARHSQIDPNEELYSEMVAETREAQLRSAEQVSECEPARRDPFGKVAAGQNLSNLPVHSISHIALSNANNHDPILVVLIVGQGRHLEIDDLKTSLREVHADNPENGDVILIDESSHQELISKGSAEEKPLHIMIVSAPIPHDDMKILEEIVAENKGLFHATGDQTVSDWAGLENAPRFVYESLDHKRAFQYALAKNSETATERSLIKTVLQDYDLAYYYGFTDFKNPANISEAKRILRTFVIPKLTKPKAPEQYQQFSSYLQKTANLGSNIRTFVAKQLGIEAPEISKKRKALLDDENGF